jgi:nicotinamide riboside transporter PnuC
MNKLFNWKISLISIFSFGLITFIININGSILLTIFAALKEMIFRFFWGGFTGRLLQKISDKTTGIDSYTLGAVIPAVLVFILTFALHYFTYTPHPLKTVGVNTILTFISGIGTIFLFKRGLMRV